MSTVTAPPAKAPLATPAAAKVSIALALVVVAVGAAAGRDCLVGLGLLTGSPWISAALRYLDGLSAQTWMLPAGIVTAVLGLLLLGAALAPRRRTHRPTRASEAWITPRDIRRVARAAGLSVTGVTEVTVGGSARSLVLGITPAGGYQTTQLADAVHSAATVALEPLAQPPRLTTRLNKRDAS